MSTRVNIEVTLSPTESEYVYVHYLQEKKDNDKIIYERTGEYKYIPRYKICIVRKHPDDIRVVPKPICDGVKLSVAEYEGWFTLMGLLEPETLGLNVE